jgi:hypothetical protein
VIVAASVLMVQDLYVSLATKNAYMELNPSPQDYEFVLHMGYMVLDTQMLWH